MLKKEWCLKNMIFCQNIIFMYYLIKRECFVYYLIKYWKNKIK